MATQKPISTISYNTESFLLEKLQSLYDSHIVQAWQYIKHKGEDGDKDHIHLRIEPNKRLDAMDLTEMFKEYEKGKDKPLGVRTWRPSKEEDWFLYAVHDSEYLMAKYGGGNEGEKLPYDWKDINTNPDYDLESSWIRAKSSLKNSASNVATQIQNGRKPSDLLFEGVNPYLLSSVSRLMYENDYGRLQKDFHKLYEENQSLIDENQRVVNENHKLTVENQSISKMYENLVDALYLEGYIVSYDEKGRLIISTVDNEERK